jgi:AraC-like DNA-binding protein
MDHGFQTISYFNRAFRRKYHATPSAYRRGVTEAK